MMKFYFLKEVLVIMQKDKTYAEQTSISNLVISFGAILLPPDVLVIS